MIEYPYPGFCRFDIGSADDKAFQIDFTKQITRRTVMKKTTSDCVCDPETSIWRHREGRWSPRKHFRNVNAFVVDTIFSNRNSKYNLMGISRLGIGLELEPG